MKFFDIILKKLSNILDTFSNDLGIDLGTASTLVYLKGEGIVLCEPSVAAIYKNTGIPLAVGEDAKRMLGKTPGSIIAIRPMKDGVIADFDVTEEMLRQFIRKALPRRWGTIGPRVVIAVPSGITEVEKRAVKDSAHRAGARDVIPLEEPIAAAIGVGLPIEEPQGSMIIDIGGGTTEIAVISLGGIVHARSIRVGGDCMDTAIVEHMKKNYNIMIGERTAEEIKIKIGFACPPDEEIDIDVRGRDLITGLPKLIKANSEEIRLALSTPLKEIVEATKVTLERTPPEIAADLIERGIVLCGGGALLRGLDKLISEETGLACFVADDPLTAVALGTGKIIEDPKLLKKLALASTF